VTLPDLQIACTSIVFGLLGLIILIRRRGRFAKRHLFQLVAVVVAAQEIPVAFLLCSCASTGAWCTPLGAAIGEPYKYHIFFAGLILLVISVGGTVAVFREELRSARPVSKRRPQPAELLRESVPDTPS
jgi:hypothetical protein